MSASSSTAAHARSGPASRADRAEDLRFRALFEQAPVSMQRFTPDGYSIQVNRAYEALFHLTDEQLAAAKFNLLRDPQIAAIGLLPLFKRAFAGEPVLTEPAPFSPGVSVPGGRQEIRWIRGHFFPIRDADGAIREIIAIHEDVTDQIKAEQEIKELNQHLEAKIAERTHALEQEVEERRVTEAALKESEQRFRAIIETQVELVMRYTADGTVTYVNPAHARMYGLQPGECLGQNWIAGLSLEMANTVRLQIRRLEVQNPVFELVVPKIIRKTGRAVWEHWVNRGIFDEDGHLQEIQAVGRDVTELVETEKRLKESEVKFRRLVENTRAGVVLLDGFTIVEINPAGQQLIGVVSQDEAVGRSLLEFSAEYQSDGTPSPQAALLLQQRREREGSLRFEWICRNTRGLEFAIEAFTSSVEIKGRIHAQVLMYDISERKRAERELRNALERERELSQLKSNFISLVSHEYRNPLGIILSSTELLKRYHDRLSSTERMESLIDIEAATRRMASMIDNLLLMGKAEAGKLVMSPKPVDLVEFCQSVLSETISSGGTHREIRFMHEGIDSVATADEQTLRLILSNLLTNALKYSPPERSPLLSLWRVGRHAVFAVHDEGIGIPEADRPGLFGAFRRARNVGLVSGTGLGLYIVKHCVDLQQGTINLESAEGKGTTVTVTLPLFPSAAEDRPLSARTESTPRSAP
ncbi:hypothetical protein DB347_05445 [Opitutaceae bacterium EW11]|nr:hypothetical protein DB347_05445 [Opitutaceae bacterium EW11]